MAEDRARPAFHPGQVPVEGYGSGGFRFAGMSHRGSILCVPSGIAGWRPVSLDDIAAADFDAVLAESDRIDLLLIGMGPQMRLLPRALADMLQKAGIGFDPMDTGAACSTYNILLGERRPVAAALLAVD